MQLKDSTELDVACERVRALRERIGLEVIQTIDFTATAKCPFPRRLREEPQHE